MCIRDRAFSEHLITGSHDWPACAAAADSGEAAAAAPDAPRTWWKPPSPDGDVPPAGVEMPPVDIDALVAAPAGPDAAGPEPGLSRRAVRSRVACCVCARLHWADELQRVHFWRQPDGAGERSLLCDDEPQRPTRAEQEAAGGGTSDGGGAQAQACLLYTSPSPRDRTRSRMPSSA